MSRPKVFSITSIGASRSEAMAGVSRVVAPFSPASEPRQQRENALSLPQLVEAIEHELRAPRDEKAPPLDKCAVFQQLLERFTGNWSEVERFALVDPSRNYTRNLISTDHETYALILLVWNPGKYSPIHDHPCDGCWVRVIAGAVNEVRYERQGEELVEISNMTLVEGGTSYMHDVIGLHKIGNPRPDEPAVTLHLYSPPFYKCRVWFDTEDAGKSSEAHTCYFSEYGERADY